MGGHEPGGLSPEDVPLLIPTSGDASVGAVALHLSCPADDVGGDLQSRYELGIVELLLAVEERAAAEVAEVDCWVFLKRVPLSPLDQCLMLPKAN